MPLPSFKGFVPRNLGEKEDAKSEKNSSSVSQDTSPKPSLEGQDVWKSINNMLVLNRCWICETPFAKKQTRKVFQVSHLTQYMSNRKLTMQRLNELRAETGKSADDVYENDLSFFERLVIEDIPEEANNLRALWTRYCALAGDERRLNADLDKADITTWMSGLACLTNELCDRTYYKIVPDELPNRPEDDGGDKLPRKPAKPTQEECPPGCNCDNPWAFVEHAMVKNKANT